MIVLDQSGCEVTAMVLSDIVGFVSCVCPGSLDPSKRLFVVETESASVASVIRPGTDY